MLNVLDLSQQNVSLTLTLALLPTVVNAPMLDGSEASSMWSAMQPFEDDESSSSSDPQKVPDDARRKRSSSTVSGQIILDLLNTTTTTTANTCGVFFHVLFLFIRTTQPGLYKKSKNN